MDKIFLPLLLPEEEGGGGFRKTCPSLPVLLVGGVEPDVVDGIRAFIGPLLSKSREAGLNLLVDVCSGFGGSPSPSSAIKDRYSSSIFALFPPLIPLPGGPPSPGRLALQKKSRN